MATRVLSEAELAQLSTWPAEVARSDLAAYFTLTVDDLRWVRSFRSPRATADRLGLVVQLCALRFLGFVPADLSATPAEVIERLASRIGVSPAALGRYGRDVSGRSRREHLEVVVAQAGWRPCGRGEWKALGVLVWRRWCGWETGRPHHRRSRSRPRWRSWPTCATSALTASI